MRRPSAAYLPAPHVVQLLRAALLDGDDARRAWHLGRGALTAAHVDPAARWLEPLLGANLDRLGIDDVLSPSLRSRRADTAQRNERTLDHVAPLLRALDSADLPSLLLKGAALVGMDGADRSVRPMSDVDVVVPRDVAEQALALTGDVGWRPRQPVTANFLAVKHAAHFADDDGCQLDLHWYAFEECSHRGADDAMWSRALPIPVKGAVTRRPADADLLLHVCVHGARWTRTPGVRWVTDAWSILQRGEVDWSVVLEESERRHFTLRLRSTLRFLKRAVGAPVPEAVLSQLDARRPDFMERLEHASLGHEQRHLGALPSYWFGLRRASGGSSLAALMALPAHLGQAWEVESLPEFARAAFQRATHRLATGRALP